MFLKSLVMRGFKSFANKTTLAFEPGISVVVGPNGSGKSNVVDAICWVLGEQGPASLRGGKMVDVIFAGSGSKPPLGMAQVELTIDNSAGLLPVEFSEVSISRSLFRSGDSEYRLNGSICRLLDIQEMLSDAGVGKAQHTIVGQGRVDQVLAADPTAIRNIIEDAAGVGKHRRRRERALRKLESCEGNLVHLGDLLAEIRRQLKPLRQQAEIATRHEKVQRELARVELIQTSRELAGVLSELGPQRSDSREEVVAARESDLSKIDRDLAALEEARMAGASEAARFRELQLRLSGGIERLQALRKLAEERGRALRAELAGSSEAGERARIQELQRQVELLEPELEEAVRLEREEADQQLVVQEPADLAKAELAESEKAVSSALRRRAEASARVDALGRDRERAEQAAEKAEKQRLEALERLEEARSGQRGLQRDLELAAEQLEQHGRRIEPAEQEARRRADEVRELEQERAARLEEVRGLEKEAAVLKVRAGGHSQARRKKSSTRGPVPVLAEVIEIDPGLRRSLEALIGPLDSVAVTGDRDRAAAVLDDHDPDHAVTVLVGREAPEISGAEPLLSRIKTLNPVAEAVLAGVFVAPDRAAAIRLAGRHPGCIFLSPEGTAAGGNQVSRGSAEVAALLAECEKHLAAALDRMAQSDQRLEEARKAAAEASERRRTVLKERARLEEALRAREKSAQGTQVRLAQLGDAVDRWERTGREARERIEELGATLPVAEEELTAAEQDLSEAQRSRDDRREHYDRVSAEAQQMRMKAGIAAERAQQLRKRKRQAHDALSQAGQRLAGLAAKQQALQQAVSKAASVVAIAGRLAEGGTEWPLEARVGYARARDEVEVNEQRLSSLRSHRHQLAQELEQARSEARNEDLRRKELEIRKRILENRLTEDLDADPGESVRKFGYRQASAPSDQPDPLAHLGALEDDALRTRRNRLEREIAKIGNVNPLAAAEAESLAEREGFLAAQIDDVRTSRKDLRQVVVSVDAKIEELFGAAFSDVATEYENLFAILFPRGRGRLRLAEPDEMLNSGVEVEASPSGKSLKRLSLLSGGERAMAGLALLFAVFKARPSPFYILDEVEAALDDANLARFLGLLNEFRGTSQLLVVSHQKRTMEVADVLYGVTIGQDGVSKVVSERLKDFFPARIAAPGNPTQRTGVND